MRPGAMAPPAGAHACADRYRGRWPSSLPPGCHTSLHCRCTSSVTAYSAYTAALLCRHVAGRAPVGPRRICPKYKRLSGELLGGWFGRRLHRRVRPQQGCAVEGGASALEANRHPRTAVQSCLPSPCRASPPLPAAAPQAGSPAMSATRRGGPAPTKRLWRSTGSTPMAAPLRSSSAR